MSDEPEWATTVITKITSSVFITETEKQEGEHIVSSPLVRLNREWQPTDKAAQRWKDDVNRKMEQVLNNTSAGSTPGEDPGTGSPGTGPDLFYDTGYFHISITTGAVDKKHNLGQVPSRFTFFLSALEKPVWGKEGNQVLVVHPRVVYYSTTSKWSGFSVEIKDENTITITPSGETNFIWGSGSNPAKWKSGYLRILMWR